jgi:dTDP-4-dehydrorhamnose 3,5-epimerase
MQLKKLTTPLQGVLRLQLPLISDDRGAFGRVFCARTWLDLSDFGVLQQSNQSINISKGTLRGLHFQVSPYAESKIVICLQGAIYDVVLDLRPDSDTFGQHIALELYASQGDAVLIPKGCAHGFQTIEDNTHLLYFHDEVYQPNAERGISPLDKSLNIAWPAPPINLSPRDLQHPSFQEYIHTIR